MASAVHELVVFIASPSDLPAERHAVREVAEEVNTMFADRAVRIRVSGWENTPPNAGRAQAQINPEVERCDIFIGMVRRRWGTPTGAYGSGFEEEFEAAYARWRATNAPSVHLYFCELSEEDLVDPGEQLQQVLEFKARVREHHLALFAMFRNQDHLASQVKSVLTRHLLEQLILPATDDALAISPAPATHETPTAEVLADAASAQASQVLIEMGRLIRGDEGDLQFDPDRLSLIAATVSLDEEDLGPHVVNRLYTRSADLLLALGERQAWARTLLSDIGSRSPEGRTIPGWRVLAGLASEDELGAWTQDERESVVKGSFRSLTRLDLKPAQLVPREVDVQLAADDITEIAASWIRPLNTLPGSSEALAFLLRTSQEQVALLNALATHTDLNDATRRILHAVVAAQDDKPDMLADEMPFSVGARDVLEAVLDEHLAAIGDDQLERVLRVGSDQSVKRKALKLSIARSAITEQMIVQVLKSDDDTVIDTLVDAAAADPELAVRLIDVFERNELKTFDRPELGARLLAAAHTREELAALHDEAAFDVTPWEALTYLPGSAMLDEAREMVDSDAALFRERVLRVAGDEDLVAYVAGKAVLAAGSYLARTLTHSGGPADIAMTDKARVAKSLGAHLTIASAEQLRAFARMIDSTSVDDQALVASALPGLRPAILLDTLEEMLDSSIGPALATFAEASDISYLAHPALQWLLTHPDTPISELTEALYDSSATIRLSAANELIRRLDTDELRKAFRAYPNADRQYWYNVVARIDEYLYAPADSALPKELPSSD